MLQTIILVWEKNDLSYSKHITSLKKQNETEITGGNTSILQITPDPNFFINHNKNASNVTICKFQESGSIWKNYRNPCCVFRAIHRSIVSVLMTKSIKVGKGGENWQKNHFVKMSIVFKSFYYGNQVKVGVFYIHVQ